MTALKAIWKRRQRPLIVVGVVVGFIAVITVNLQPPDPESRLPEQYRLVALIQRQQQENQTQRHDVDDLRNEIEALRLSNSERLEGLGDQDREISNEQLLAGLKPMSGDGIVVTLDDSSLESAPSGNVNDLVIHSQDVQAVVNGLWAAGAEAISINGERVVATSAVLCVGNTLLLNGTVHAPPYEITAIGPDRDLYQADPLVSGFRQAATRYSLGYSVSRTQRLEVPAYSGSIRPLYAEVRTQP